MHIHILAKKSMHILILKKEKDLLKNNINLFSDYLVFQNRIFKLETGSRKIKHLSAEANLQ